MGRRADLPPGPRSRVLTAAQLTFDPAAWLPRWRARYGDPFKVAIGAGEVVMTADPTAARAIFAADPDTFEVYSRGSLTSILGERSLLLIAGPEHRRDRRLLTPPFHGARLRAYGAAIAEITRMHLGTWPIGQVRRVMDISQSVALEVILRTVFGVDDPAAAARMRAAILRGVDSAHPLLIMVPALQRRLGGRALMRRLVADQSALCDLLRQQIAATRGGAGERSDILSLLVAARHDDGAPMADDVIVDELRTLLFAGHETTAIATAWAMAWLHREPAVLGRLQAELDGLGDDPTPEAIAALPYLEATCNEALRLYPTVFAIVRRLARPYEIAGYALPPGMAVGVSIYLIHRDPALYPEPERFLPERFLGRTFGAHEFLPFGGGHRRCLGAAFALYELKIVLATLLRGGRFVTVDRRPPYPRRRNLTMAPGGGVRLRRIA